MFLLIRSYHNPVMLLQQLSTRIQTFITKIQLNCIGEGTTFAISICTIAAYSIISLQILRTISISDDDTNGWSISIGNQYMFGADRWYGSRTYLSKYCAAQKLCVVWHISNLQISLIKSVEQQFYLIKQPLTEYLIYYESNSYNWKAAM